MAVGAPRRESKCRQGRAESVEGEIPGGSHPGAPGRTTSVRTGVRHPVSKKKQPAATATIWGAWIGNRPHPPHEPFIPVHGPPVPDTLAPFRRGWQRRLSDKRQAVRRVAATIFLRHFPFSILHFPFSIFILPSSGDIRQALNYGQPAGRGWRMEATSAENRTSVLDTSAHRGRNPGSGKEKERNGEERRAAGFSALKRQ